MKGKIALFGAMGLVGCFAPLGSPGDGPVVSWWELRHDADLALKVYAVIAAFGIATAIGLLGRTATRRDAALATTAFASVLFVFWTILVAANPPWPHVGAFLMAGAAIGGALSSAAAVITGR